MVVEIARIAVGVEYSLAIMVCRFATGLEAVGILVGNEFGANGLGEAAVKVFADEIDVPEGYGVALSN